MCDIIYFHNHYISNLYFFYQREMENNICDFSQTWDGDNGNSTKKKLRLFGSTLNPSKESSVKESGEGDESVNSYNLVW